MPSRKPARGKTTRTTRASSQHPIVMKTAAGEPDGARTVVYIHGIGNKPPEPVLRCTWDQALFGQRMGDRTRMAYWVVRQRHGLPLAQECGAGDYSVPETTARGIGIRAIEEDPDNDRLIERLAGENDEARKWLREVRDAMAPRGRAGGVGAKGLGDVAWDGLSWLFTGLLLGDVHDFFFDSDRREAMRQSLLDVLEPGGGPFVVVAHSQGTMIAYDVLRELNKLRFPVKLFVTIGSPLGLPPVRSRFKKWTKQSKLLVPECVERWINVANRGDIVAADPDLTNDIGKTTRFYNPPPVDSPNDALKDDEHSATGYLQLPEVHVPVMDVVGGAFAHPLGLQVIGPDLVNDMETRSRSERHPVLIELVSRGSDAGDVAVVGDRIERRIAELVGESTALEEARVERLRYWVAARLTRTEVERLRTEFAALEIRRIWRNATKRALINESSAIIQARPANLAYAALGEGIRWAVLDTGIRADHPHFAENKTVDAVYDCTRRGAPMEMPLAPRKHDDYRRLDGNGHGTHVAGIIAGRLEVAEGPKDESHLFAGMAPKAKLLGFKVLNDKGEGEDAYIIKALDRIAEMNEKAGRLVVHGVNLSLGGGFDPSVYGCGHTPLCKELRRLWNQGVLVVLAAGNEGFAELRTTGGEEWPANMDLSIGDPANLEEAIAVGAVHRQNPHTYGISYFSSRGPTADGRAKPDVVAPGEKILSARHDWRGGAGNTKSRRTKAGYDAEDLYVEMSGTSMAAPHVSGLLAAFLSVRREFVGEPGRVKGILLEACTDLDRDRYVQGHGLPNLVRMLAGT